MIHCLSGNDATETGEHAYKTRGDVTECMYVPVWLSIKQRTAWMNVDNLRVNQRPIPFLRVLLSRMTEEAAENRLLYSCCVLTT